MTSSLKHVKLIVEWRRPSRFAAKMMLIHASMIRSVASGRKFYQLPPDKENTLVGLILFNKNNYNNLYLYSLLLKNKLQQWLLIWP